MLGLLLLVIALIVYGSLYPWEFNFHNHVDAVWMVLHHWPANWDRWELRDFILNVALYMPVGALAYLAMVRRRHSRAVMVLSAAALGCALSATMEFFQAYDLGRDAGPEDVITNTTGALTGALLALLFQPTLETLVHRGTRRVAMAAALLTVIWGTSQLYPFFPVLTTHRLYGGLAFLASRPAFEPAAIWSVAAEWYALWLLLDAFRWPARNLWAVVSLLVLPLRLFVEYQVVGWKDLLGAGLAFVLWWVISSRRRLAFGTWMLVSAILVSELAPFHFSSRASPFSWVPFVATLSADRQRAVLILLRKMFDYGAAVWGLHATGWSYVRCGGLLAAALFALELLQRYLPGRTPESTDAVLALLMAIAVWLASDFQPRRR